MPEETAVSTLSVFVSHIQEEAALAAILKRRLAEQFGELIDVFASSDVASIAAGDRWLDSTEGALRKADVEIILLSSASLKRPWVNFEAGAAWVRGITILPLCHSGLHTSDLAMPLCLIQGVEAGTESGVERLFARIATCLKVGKPDAPVREIVEEVKAFERSYGLRADKPRWEPAPGNAFQEDRLVGEWEGEGCDIEVPGHMTLDLKCSYRLDMVLRREGGRVCGEMTVYVNERGHTAVARMDLVNVSGDNYTLTYRLTRANANHFGIMMFHLLPLGDELRGYFLTNKVFEPKLATGTVLLRQKQPPEA